MNTLSQIRSHKKPIDTFHIKRETLPPLQTTSGSIHEWKDLFINEFLRDPKRMYERFQNMSSEEVQIARQAWKEYEATHTRSGELTRLPMYEKAQLLYALSGLFECQESGQYLLRAGKRVLSEIREAHNITLDIQEILTQIVSSLTVRKEEIFSHLNRISIGHKTDLMLLANICDNWKAHPEYSEDQESINILVLLGVITGILIHYGILSAEALPAGIHVVNPAINSWNTYFHHHAKIKRREVQETLNVA